MRDQMPRRRLRKKMKLSFDISKVLGRGSGCGTWEGWEGGTEMASGEATYAMSTVTAKLPLAIKQ